MQGHGTKQPIRVMSALPIRGAFDTAIGPELTARGESCTVDWSPTTIIVEKLQRGETCDAVFVVAETLDQLIAEGRIDARTRTDIVRSRYGVAVKAGAPHPDVATLESFQATLLSARSVAFSRSGASGIYFQALLDRLGLAEEIKAKATIVPAGLTAERLVTGEADIAIQQISELLAVPGIEIAGPFPEGAQQTIDFAYAATSDAANPDGARAFLDALRSPKATSAYKQAGLDPLFEARADLS